MNTKSIIDEFKAYRKDNASAIQMLIKSDNVAKQYYDGVAEATENFTDYDPEILEASDFVKVMERFNAKMKPFLSKETPSTNAEKVAPRAKTKSTAKAKTSAKAGIIVKKAKASRKVTAKPRVKKETSATNAEKAAPSAKTKSTAKAKTSAKSKSTKSVEPAKPITRTQVETPEHKQIKRFLAIRKNETVQLAMTAYKSLQKDIAERKIRAVSPQAAIIKGIQLAYYKYITGQTNSLTLSEAILKEANEFVGSQKPYETVAMVKRFIGWTGQGKTEKQIADYLKEAEKVIGAARENDPYYDELKAITKALKSTKAGDTVVADNVGLSGLRSNTIKVRK